MFWVLKKISPSHLSNKPNPPEVFRVYPRWGSDSTWHIGWPFSDNSTLQDIPGRSNDHPAILLKRNDEKPYGKPYWVLVHFGKKNWILKSETAKPTAKSWGIARTSSISTHWFRIKKSANPPCNPRCSVNSVGNPFANDFNGCKPHVVLSSSLGYLFEIHFCCRRKWFQCLAFSLKLPFLIGSVYGILNLHLPYQSTTWILWVLLVVVL